MPSGYRQIFPYLHRMETRYDVLRQSLKRRLGWLGPVQIIAYRGHGTRQALYLNGRVLEDKNISPVNGKRLSWHNLRMMYKRFESDEIAGVRLRAQFEDATQDVITDDEGYFQLRLQPTKEMQGDKLWRDVSLTLLDEVRPGQGRVQTKGQVMTPLRYPDFGVISDVDDTIIKTQATTFFMMLWLTLRSDAATRLPFPGVAAFYRALQQGVTGRSHNPIFYVSSSPWNLYDLLIDFMDAHGVPRGPLFLRDFGLDRDKFIQSSHQQHKLTQINALLDTYDHMPFILIGDSGQKDPEIYCQAAREKPGRIRAIYIRNVTSWTRAQEVLALATKARAYGSDMRLITDTVAAAKHAAMRGFITSEAISDVHVETTQAASRR